MIRVICLLWYNIVGCHNRTKCIQYYMRAYDFHFLCADCYFTGEKLSLRSARPYDWLVASIHVVFNVLTISMWNWLREKSFENVLEFATNIELFSGNWFSFRIKDVFHNSGSTDYIDAIYSFIIRFLCPRGDRNGPQIVDIISVYSGVAVKDWLCNLWRS